MSGAVQPWMVGERRSVRIDATRRAPLRIGLSEIFWGERGRELAFVREAGRLIEELGYDTLWLPEHVVKFATYTSKHPYAGARLGSGWEHQTRGELDGPITAVAIAAVTSRLRMGTYVNLLGERNPVMFAREVATVDHLTEGRFTLGVGIGWSREEYEALGVPFERRGDRVDEYIRAMRELWLAERSEFHGEFVDFGPLLAYPKPLQRPCPPILVAGQSKRGIERAAELGDGLILYNLEIPEIELCIDEFQRGLERHGRDGDGLSIVVGRRNVAGDAYSLGQPLPEDRLLEIWNADAEFVRSCRALGPVTDVVLSPRLPTQGYLELMRRYATLVGVGVPA